MLLLAFFVFLRHPRDRAARLLLVFSAAVFSSDGVSQIVSGTNVVGPAEMFYRRAYWPAQFFNSLIWPLTIAPVYTHLFLSFPVLKTPLQRHPRATLVALYGYMPVLTLLAGVLSSGRPLVFWSIWSNQSFIDFVAVLLIAIVSMAHTLMTLRQSAERTQVRWLAWGTLITSVGALSGGVLVALGWTGQNLPVVWILTRLLLLGFPVAMAIAILRYHLFDIDIVIRHTLIYSALTGILVLFYLGSVVLLQQIFRTLTGQVSDLAIIVSTLGIAALFNPLRSRLQHAIDQRFYRSHSDATRALAAFNATVRDEVDLEVLTAQLIDVVDKTMQPANVSLWLMKK
jgi:hypothetical protein